MQIVIYIVTSKYNSIQTNLLKYADMVAEGELNKGIDIEYSEA